MSVWETQCGFYPFCHTLIESLAWDKGQGALSHKRRCPYEVGLVSSGLGQGVKRGFRIC